MSVILTEIQFQTGLRFEGVHLTLPPHISAVQVKSGVYYITCQWVASSEQNEGNVTQTLTLTLNHFYDLFTAYLFIYFIFNVGKL